MYSHYTCYYKHGSSAIYSHYTCYYKHGSSAIYSHYTCYYKHGSSSMYSCLISLLQFLFIHAQSALIFYSEAPPCRHWEPGHCCMRSCLCCQNSLYACMFVASWELGRLSPYSVVNNDISFYMHDILYLVLSWVQDHYYKLMSNTKAFNWTLKHSTELGYFPLH